MTFLPATASAYNAIWPPAGALDFERDRAVVTAMIMLEVLNTIRMDLMKTIQAQIGGADEFRNRIDRVDAAISGLRRVVGLSDATDGESLKPGCRLETTLRRAPVSER